MIPGPIDPDIRRASTLPGSFYTDPAMFDRCRERVFARSWQLAADDQTVRVPGQVHPFTLLEGCLDEPLLMTRDSADRVHVVSNVCTHRGHLVCDGDGVVNGLRCRYHGRRFDLDGTFHSMPEFDGAEGFPSAADNLRRVETASWKNLQFVSLDPAVSFTSLMGDLRDRLDWLPVETWRLDPARSREYMVRAHWALYCDNFLEGFHVPYVHAGLAPLIDYAGYSTELGAWGSLQIGAAASGDEVFDIPEGTPLHGQRVAALWLWLFPNTMLNFYPWGLSVNIVCPLGPALTKVRYLAYVGDPARLARGAGGDLDRVEREDEAVIETVQRGLRSRLYEKGRFSPRRETGVHHFHALLARCLAD